MRLYVIGVNAKTHSVEEREKYSLLEQQIIQRNKLMIESGLLSEIVTLSTCNRIEHYFITQQPLENITLKLFNNDLPEGFYIHQDLAASHHLFEVVSGLDSKILGENEILGQIRKFYFLAQENQLTSKRLNVLFQKAIYVGKRVRTVTDISKCSVSTGGIIQDKIKKAYKDLSQLNVLLIGAGEISRNVAISLHHKGVRNISVSNRSEERGRLLANELEATYIPIDQLYHAIKKADIIISSTSAPHYIISMDHADNLTGEQKILFDLAVPRDIDPAVSQLDNITLYNIDDIATVTNLNQVKREKEVHKSNKVLAIENCKYCISNVLKDDGCSVTNFFNFNQFYKRYKKEAIL